MRLEMFCYVNLNSVDKAKEIISRCNGKLIDKELERASKEVFSTEQFNVLENYDFVTMEIIF